MIFFRRYDVEFVSLHRARIERASRHMLRIGYGRVVAGAFVFGHGEAPVVAAYAGLDVLEPVLFELGHPFAVCQELPCHTHGVDPAFRNGFRRNGGFHTSRAYDRNVNELFDVRHVVEVAVLRHIGRRMRPIPRVVSAVVRIEHIVAGVLKIFGRLFALFHIPADFDVVLAGHRARTEPLGLAHHGVSERYGIILAAFGFDRLYHRHGETVPVLETAAVFVRAVIGVFQRELVEQIAFVHRVHFHAVDAGFLAHLRGLRVGVDDVLDLLFGERAAGDVLRPSGRKLARRRADVGRIEDGFHERAQEFVAYGQREKIAEREGTPEPRRELHEKFSPGLMDLFHIGFQLSECAFRLVKPLSADEVPERRDAGDDESDVVFCALEEEIRRVLVEVVRFHPAEQRSPPPWDRARCGS